MDDIVVRLRDSRYGAMPSQRAEAADEIERLRSQLVKERERCAKVCEHWIETFKDRDIQFTSASDYAIDAINDIADVIRSGIDPYESSAPSGPPVSTAGEGDGSASDGHARGKPVAYPDDVSKPSDKGTVLV